MHRVTVWVQVRGSVTAGPGSTHYSPVSALRSNRLSGTQPPPHTSSQPGPDILTKMRVFLRKLMKMINIEAWAPSRPIHWQIATVESYFRSKKIKNSFFSPSSFRLIAEYLPLPECPGLLARGQWLIPRGWGGEGADKERMKLKVNLLLCFYCPIKDWLINQFNICIYIYLSLSYQIND